MLTYADARSTWARDGRAHRDDPDPRRVVGRRGVEPADGFIAYARRRVDDPRVPSRSATPAPSPARPPASTRWSPLVLNFVPEALGAVREMSRVAVPGGVVGAYVWDYAVGMELIRAFWDSAVALDPAARELDEGVRFPPAPRSRCVPSSPMPA